MISLKKYGYRFLVGLLVFGLFPLSVSAQKTSGEDEIIVEMVRPPMDSVNNIKEYTFKIIKDKKTGEPVVIVYDDDGTPVKLELDDDELEELGYVEDVQDLDKDQIIDIDRLPDDSLIISHEDDDGIIVEQEITLDDAIALDLVDSDGEPVKSDGEPVDSDSEPVESEDELDSNAPENQKSDETQEGVPMPSTATAIYNYLALGALLIVLGSGLYIIQRKGD